MCNNAMTYNHPETIYYKAARKLLHYGIRILSADRIIALRTVLPFMEEVRADQLGFEFPKEEEIENTEPTVEPVFEVKRDERRDGFDKPKEAKKSREMPR